MSDCASKAQAEHPELPFESPEAIPDEALDESNVAPGSPSRKMGRPRKWATEAERKRAYRERLAADVAEPDRLRRELRNARRQSAEKSRRLARAERELARAEAEIERRSQREAELDGIVERLEARVDDWRSQANTLARNLESERSATPLPTVDSSVPLLPSVRPEPPVNRNRSKKRRRRP